MALKTERFEMRVETQLLDMIDKWRSKQPGLPSRAEATRQLIRTALKAPKENRPVGKKILK